MRRSAPSASAERARLGALKIILCVLATCAVLALVIWSSKLITVFLEPCAIEAENIPQHNLAYPLITRPIDISGRYTKVALVSGMVRGRYRLKLACTQQSGPGPVLCELAVLVDRSRVAKIPILLPDTTAYEADIVLTRPSFELGMQLLSTSASAITIEQADLVRASDFVYTDPVGRYGLPAGRHIDFFNPMSFRLDLPSDALGLSVRAKVEEMSPRLPRLSVVADGERLGVQTLRLFRWSEYLFGLGHNKRRWVELSIRVENPGGAAVIDRIIVLRRSRLKAYLCNVAGSILRALSAEREAAKCFLASLKFYPGNWTTRNHLFGSLLRLGLTDEAAELLWLFDDFVPRFPSDGVWDERVRNIAVRLVEYGRRERAEALVDKYFRIFDPQKSASLVSRWFKKAALAHTLRAAAAGSTFVPAAKLRIGLAAQLFAGRETSAILDGLGCRPDANTLCRRTEKRRLLAEVYEAPSGLISPSFVLSERRIRKMLVSGWEEEPISHLVWGIGTQSVIVVEIDRKNDVLLTFRVKPRRTYNLIPRMLVSFNGQELREIMLLPGWREYQTFVPAEVQNVGKNLLTLRYRYFGPSVAGRLGQSDRKVAFHYIEWWRTDARFKDRFIYETGTVVGDHKFVIDGQMRRTLFLHPPRVIFFDVVVRADTTLSFGLGISEKIWDRGCDGTLFEVLLLPQAEPGAPITLLRRFLNPCANPDERHWFDYHLNLGQYKGTIGRLVFKTLPGQAGDFWYDWAGFSDPTIQETVDYIDLSFKSLSASIICEKGKYRIGVVAKGSPVRIVKPLIGVLIDGHIAARLLVKSPYWDTYWLETQLNSGPHKITLYFANEQPLWQSWEPMRLWISDLVLVAAGE